jgi:site-specific DNA-methyltransferase (adenine-specific)
MKLINGDCLDKLKDISDNIIDLVILDLPYGQTDCKWDKKINLDQLWIQLKRIGKPNTPYFFFTTTKFGYELIKANEKWFRYDLVWNKDNAVGFLNARKMPMRSHEMLYVFYDKLPYYNINDNHIHKPKINNTLNKNASLYENTNILIQCSGPQYEPKLPTSILDYPSNKNRRKQNHSTEKPIELLKWIIKYYSKQDDIILDPTMGSGSTGVACIETNRKFIGIELDKSIYDSAVNRINNLL